MNAEKGRERHAVADKSESSHIAIAILNLLRGLRGAIRDVALCVDARSRLEGYIAVERFGGSAQDDEARRAMARRALLVR